MVAQLRQSPPRNIPLRHVCSLLVWAVCVPAVYAQALAPASSSSAIKGPGCTTATVIDWDCDGYGPGSPLGPDADDADPAVNTAASALAKYGSTAALLAHLGYTPRSLLFIAPSGNDAAGQPNNEAQPYRSWNGVAALVQAGDAVIWRAGTYADHPALSTSGTPGSPIILMAYPGERVVLDQPSNGIDFVGQSNITIDGLVLQNSTNGLGEGMFFGDPAVNITIRNVDDGRRARGILGMNGLSNVLIEHSIFHDTTLEHCIYLGAREKPNSNITVRANLIYNGAYNGFQHNGRVTGLVVDSNIIYNNVLSALSFLEGVSNSVIRNNVMFGNGRNCLLIWDYYGDPTQNINPYDQVNNTFVNNTCWVGAKDPTGMDIQQPAINIDNGGFPVSMDNQKFENNIFVTQNYAVFQFGQPRYLNTAIIRNNVMLDAGGTPYLNYAGVDYGFSSLNGWDALKGGNIQADPLFRAAQTAWYATPGNYDFTLLPGSPAIGLAITADAPPADLLQFSRGAAPDAGAYQSGAAATGLRVLLAVLPAGQVGVGYSQTLTALGGSPPYTWTVAAGSLPPGLTLAPSGVISGLPGTVAAPSFTVRVADSASNSATATVTVPIVGVTLQALTCAATTDSARSNVCSVTLAAPAPAGGVSVQLSTHAPSIQLPQSITIPAGAVSAAFTVDTGGALPIRGAAVTAALGVASLSTPLTVPRPGRAP